MSPFDIIKSINKKERISIPKEDYNQWFLNRVFSNYIDCVLLTNEINKYQVDNDKHYEFLYQILDKRNRFAKMEKTIPNENLEKLSETFNINKFVMLDYLSLLTDEQKQELLKTTMKGGNNNNE